MEGGFVVELNQCVGSLTALSMVSVPSTLGRCSTLMPSFGFQVWGSFMAFEFIFFVRSTTAADSARSLTSALSEFLTVAAHRWGHLGLVNGGTE